MRHIGSETINDNLHEAVLPLEVEQAEREPDAPFPDTGVVIKRMLDAGVLLGTSAC